MITETEQHFLQNFPIQANKKLSGRHSHGFTRKYFTSESGVVSKEATPFPFVWVTLLVLFQSNLQSEPVSIGIFKKIDGKVFREILHHTVYTERFQIFEPVLAENLFCSLENLCFVSLKIVFPFHRHVCSNIVLLKKSLFFCQLFGSTVPVNNKLYHTDGQVLPSFFDSHQF